MIKQKWLTYLAAFTLALPASGWAAGSPLPLKLPPPNPAAILSQASTDALAGTLRGYLVGNVPPVLYEGNRGWGKTKPVVRGIKWTGKDLPLHPHLQYADKNDGDWRKIRIIAPKLADTLVFDVRSLKSPEPGRMTFDVFV